MKTPFRICSLCCSLLLLLLKGLSAQPPSHDVCSKARKLAIGNTLSGLSNKLATTIPAQQPASLPISCIKTFENDLWFSFTTEEPYTHYELMVRPSFCNTPAGLQAMIIQAPTCQPDSFQYRACSNPRKDQNLYLYFQESRAGLRHLIYIDGYDGTQCDFSLQLNAYTRNPQTMEDFLYEELDYAKPEKRYEPQALDLRFVNNEAVMEWEDDTQEGTLLFQVQAYIKQGGYELGQVLRSLEPQKSVGAGTATYRFQDQRPFVEGETYCYRLVRIDEAGTKAYSQPICQTARIIEEFYVSPLTEADQEGFYLFKYINYKKQDLTFRLLDAQQQELKKLVKPKAKRGEENVSIDLRPYPPGLYYLKAEGKEGFFLRRFVLPSR